MERTSVLDAMNQLKLYGMKGAYDEILATAVKRRHEPQQIIGDLLTAEIREKQARSVKYQMTIAKMPLAKELEEFDFEVTPVNDAPSVARVLSTVQASEDAQPVAVNLSDIAAMGGTLSLDEDPGLDGRGARFVVRLPRRGGGRKEDER